MMNNEVELKLQVSEAVINVLRRHLTERNLLSHHNIFLGNHYYDTTDSFFAKNKMGLRVRRENQQFTFTLKTDGSVIGGLHIRPEYNLKLANNEPNLALLVDKFHLDSSWKELSLRSIFTTDFEREVFLIEHDDATQIEVAIDRGQIQAGDKQELILEVEFELKQGHVQDLLNFVRDLPLDKGIYLSSISKAQRGYALSNNTVPQVQDWLEKWRDFLDFEQSAVDFSSKLGKLFKLEQEIVEETILLGQHYFSQDFLRTVERIGAFFNLYHFYIEHHILLEKAFNAQENGELTHYWQLFAESNQQCFSACKAMIHLHSGSRDNNQAIATLFELLQSNFYVQRMLNIISLTYSSKPKQEV